MVSNGTEPYSWIFKSKGVLVEWIVNAWHTSRVESSAQVLSCQLDFVYGVSKLKSSANFYVNTLFRFSLLYWKVLCFFVAGTNYLKLRHCLFFFLQQFLLELLVNLRAAAAEGAAGRGQDVNGSCYVHSVWRQILNEKGKNRKKRKININENKK